MKTLLAGLLAVLVAVGFSYVTAATEQVRIIQNLRDERILLPLSAPDRSGLTVVDDVLFEDEDIGLGTLVFYDNPRTKLSVDYIEFYDAGGNLLVVSWIDRYGICHIAMDRGLLNGRNPQIERVLILIPAGTQL